MARKKVRMSWATLSRNKTQGGLAAPDIERYYTATIIARMLEWTNENSDKRWVRIENTLSRTQLNKTIWIPPKFRE